MTNVERKIASNDTINVRVGQGLRSKTSIHNAKIAACRYTKFMEPANDVILSAIRSCVSLARFCHWLTTAGWWSTFGSSLGMNSNLLELLGLTPRRRCALECCRNDQGR